MAVSGGGVIGKRGKKKKKEEKKRERRKRRRGKKKGEEEKRRRRYDYINMYTRCASEAGASEASRPSEKFYTNFPPTIKTPRASPVRS